MEERFVAIQNQAIEEILNLVEEQESRLALEARQKAYRLQRFYKACRWWFAFFMLSSLIFIAQAYNNQAHSIEIDLTKIAIIESSNNPYAVNKSSGCIGLYQINPKGAMADWNQFHRTKYRRLDLFKPEVNTVIAEWYFYNRIPQMLDHYNLPVTLETVLASYNWGIGHVRRWVRNGMHFSSLPRETQNYIKKYRSM